MREYTDILALGDTHFQAKFVETDNNFNGYCRGMSYQAARKVDRHIDTDMRDRFVRLWNQFGQDVRALDTHRDRFNGLPRYNDARAFCGLKRAVAWKDFGDYIHQDVRLSS